MAKFTEREIAAVRDATIRGYLADLRRSYPRAPEELVDRAANALYEMYTEAIREGGITRDHAVRATQMVHDIVLGEGRAATVEPSFPQRAVAGASALLAALAALAGRSDQLVIGMVRPGQLRLQRVSVPRSDAGAHLETIFERDRARLAQIVATRLGVGDAAEDAVRRAYARVAKRMADPATRERIRQPDAYLTTAVLREVGASQEGQAAGPDQELLGALARLPDSQRDGVILRCVYGFDTAEAAARLNMTPTAVAAAVDRAIQDLEQAFRDDQRE